MSKTQDVLKFQHDMQWVIKFNHAGIDGAKYFALPRFTDDIDEAYGFQYKKDACAMVTDLIGLTAPVDRRKNFRKQKETT